MSSLDILNLSIHNMNHLIKINHSLDIALLVGNYYVSSKFKIHYHKCPPPAGKPFKICRYIASRRRNTLAHYTGDACCSKSLPKHCTSIAR